MTKVGIYVVLRLWALFFLPSEGLSGHFGESVLVWGGLATCTAAAVGLMTTIRLDRVAGFSIIVSSGTLLAAVGMGTPDLTSAALFYVLGATLGASALFLLVELIDRIGTTRKQQLPDVEIIPGEDTNLDDAQMPLVGRVFPVSIASLGLAFMCAALIVAGLPPLPGFIAKVSLLRGITSGGQGIHFAAWVMFGVLLASSFAATIALARAGIQSLWATGRRLAPDVRTPETIALGVLISCCILLSVFAERVVRYTRATADQLHAPSLYIDSVLSTDERPRTTSEAP
jgi:multicomponent K+:H+ antiporter subunit D